jgi:aspartyl-tRNA(Asn)/glutamyl-tRNA(Gln) amidotransferase subunit A
VAARLSFAALGTDTGGSIRQPAALTGTVGLKPTYGRVSRYGVVAFASSLDQVGPIARTVADAAALLQVLAVHDPLDATSSASVAPDYLGRLDAGVAGLRLGVPREYFELDGLDPEVRAAVEAATRAYQTLGATLVPISLPHTKYALATYYLLAPAEASSNLARYDGVRYGLRVPAGGLREMYAQTRRRGFGPEAKRRIMLGTYALSAGYYDAYYLKAQKVRTLIRQDFAAAWSQVDAILSPTTPTTAFRLGEKVDDPLAMYANDVFTLPCNLAGLPGLSLPCGFSRAGMPIGLQILGKPLDEATVLRVGQSFERAHDFVRAPPLGEG